MGSSQLGGVEKTEAPQREVERIRARASSINQRAHNCLGRLQGMRSRLLGEGEPEAAGSAAVAQAVRAEFGELHDTLDSLCETIEAMEHNITRLETI